MKDKIFNKRNYIILGIILVLILVSIGGYYVYKNYIYDYESKLVESINDYFEDGEYEDIRDIKDILKSYGKDKAEEIRNIALGVIDTNILNFNNEVFDEEEKLDKSSEDLKDKLKELHKECTANVDGTIYLLKESKYEDLIEDLEEMINSKENYIKGLNAYENEEFDEALEYFDKILKSDGSFKEAAKYIDKVLESAVKVLKEEVEERLEDLEETNESKVNHYKKVLEYLDNGALEIVDGIEKSETYLEMQKDYIIKLKEAIDLYVKDLESSKDYDTIITWYEYYKKYVEVDTEDYTALEETINSFKDKKSEEENKNTSTNTNNNTSSNSSSNQSKPQTKPESKPEVKPEPKPQPTTISLNDIKSYTRERSDGSYYSLGERASTIDWEGTRYNDGISLANYYLYSYSHTYSLGNKYTKFTSKIIRLDTTVASLKVNIYTDGKLVYTKTLTPEMNYYNVSVNLTGVTSMKIETISLTDKKAGTSYALANPTLTLK